MYLAFHVGLLFIGIGIFLLIIFIILKIIDNNPKFLVDITGTTICIGLIIILSFLSGIITICIWKADINESTSRTKYINKEFGKNYTVEEYFYNGKIIESQILTIKDKKYHIEIEWLEGGNYG